MKHDMEKSEKLFKLALNKSINLVHKFKNKNFNSTSYDEAIYLLKKSLCSAHDGLKNDFFEKLAKKIVYDNKIEVDTTKV